MLNYTHGLWLNDHWEFSYSVLYWSNKIKVCSHEHTQMDRRKMLLNILIGFLLNLILIYQKFEPIAADHSFSFPQDQDQNEANRNLLVRIKLHHIFCINNDFQLMHIVFIQRNVIFSTLSVNIIKFSVVQSYTFVFFFLCMLYYCWNQWNPHNQRHIEIYMFIFLFQILKRSMLFFR